MYAKITHDSLWDESFSTPSRVGTVFGSREQAEGDLLRFRTLDDDREVYYSGESDDDGLDAVYEFAYADAGATVLEVKQPDGSWLAVIA